MLSVLVGTGDDLGYIVSTGAPVLKLAQNRLTKASHCVAVGDVEDARIAVQTSRISPASTFCTA